MHRNKVLRTHLVWNLYFFGRLSTLFAYEAVERLLDTLDFHCCGENLIFSLQAQYQLTHVRFG
jgi:hypothetical protein